MQAILQIMNEIEKLALVFHSYNLSVVLREQKQANILSKLIKRMQNLDVCRKGNFVIVFRS